MAIIVSENRGRAETCHGKIKTILTVQVETGMDLSNKTGLLLDDIAEMRASVRIQLADCGVERCTTARNVKEAVERLSESHYDLIVCDYNLGQGTDGQQFLELVRRKHLLPLTSAFLMITGETGYEQVSTAAEYSPDDYLLKPFTADTLTTRLIRILEKKEALRPIFVHMGPQGDDAKALMACNLMISQKTRYIADVVRLKGELLMSSRAYDEALALYNTVLEQRATPWATVGKAQAMLALGNDEEAKNLLTQGLSAYPNYLAGYDLLARTLEKTDKAAAQAVVERALKVSPSTQRHRELGTLAMENKDFGRAEAAFRTAVTKDRSGFFKTHQDYAALAKSCVAQGKTKEALAAVKEMGQSFAKTPELEARQAALESQVQLIGGDPKAAGKALDQAMQMQKKGYLDVDTLLEVAQACFSAGRADEAKKVLQGVIEDHYENEEVLERVRRIFELIGREGEGKDLVNTTCEGMILLNNEAVGLAKAGELDKAILMLVEAADRLRNNAQVSLNAAQAILMRVQKQGMDLKQVEQAHRYIIQARTASPTHAKLPGTIAFYRKVAPESAPKLGA